MEPGELILFGEHICHLALKEKNRILDGSPVPSMYFIFPFIFTSLADFKEKFVIFAWPSMYDLL